jgi:hypothetical protein
MAEPSLAPNAAKDGNPPTSVVLPKRSESPLPADAVEKVFVAARQVL